MHESNAAHIRHLGKTNVAWVSEWKHVWVRAVWSNGGADRQLALPQLLLPVLWCWKAHHPLRGHPTGKPQVLVLQHHYESVHRSKECQQTLPATCTGFGLFTDILHVTIDHRTSCTCNGPKLCWLEIASPLATTVLLQLICCCFIFIVQTAHKSLLFAWCNDMFCLVFNYPPSD